MQFSCQLTYIPGTHFCVSACVMQLWTTCSTRAHRWHTHNCKHVHTDLTHTSLFPKAFVIIFWFGCVDSVIASVYYVYALIVYNYGVDNYSLVRIVWIEACYSVSITTIFPCLWACLLLLQVECYLHGICLSFLHWSCYSRWVSRALMV